MTPTSPRIAKTRVFDDRDRVVKTARHFAELLVGEALDKLGRIDKLWLLIDALLALIG